MTIAPRATTTTSHCYALRNGNPAMPRGRIPEGEYTLSNAERQARYRARREAQPAPVVRLSTASRPALPLATLERPGRPAARAASGIWAILSLLNPAPPECLATH